jgi:hypothetical protein
MERTSSGHLLITRALLIGGKKYDVIIQYSSQHTHGTYTVGPIKPFSVGGVSYESFGFNISPSKLQGKWGLRPYQCFGILQPRYIAFSI